MTSSPIRVLLTDPHLRGGAQVRYIANLAAQLVQLGHHVTVGCRPGSVLVERAREAGAACLDRLTLRGGLHPVAWTRDIAEIRRFIREERPDLLHVSGSQDHWVCGLANRLMRRPVCVVRTRHNTYPVSNNWPNRILNRSWTDYQIVVCNVVCTTLAQQQTFDGSRMCSIHNGVDAEAFRPDPAARHRARAEFGYENNHIVCGIAARLVAAKGHEFLFRAIASLCKELPHLRVLVLGQGDKETNLRLLAKSCGIADKVLFAGFRNDMAYCVQAFDIGIQPSTDCDTSSFSLKEQMAAEIPVIASDYGGLVEIVSDGVEGLVVPTGTVEPLAGAIRALALEPARRATMGKAGRERVLGEFTVQVFAARTVEAYRRAIEIHQARRSA